MSCARNYNQLVCMEETLFVQKEFCHVTKTLCSRKIHHNQCTKSLYHVYKLNCLTDALLVNRNRYM